MRTLAVIGLLVAMLATGTASAQGVDYRWRDEFGHGTNNASIISRDGRVEFGFFCAVTGDLSMGVIIGETGGAGLRWPRGPAVLQIVVDGCAYMTGSDAGVGREVTRRGKGELEAAAAIAKTRSRYFSVEVPAMN